MTRRYRVALFLAFVLVGIIPLAASAQVAVVVDEASGIDDLSLTELRRLFLGKSTLLPDGTTVSLIEQASAGELFYDRVLGMSVSKVRKHWMKLVFAGDFANPPVTVDRTSDLERLISGDRDALAIINLADVSDSMKVLSIDGIKPGADGYPIGIPKPDPSEDDND